METRNHAIYILTIVTLWLFVKITACFKLTIKCVLRKQSKERRLQILAFDASLCKRLSCIEYVFMNIFTYNLIGRRKHKAASHVITQLRLHFYHFEHPSTVRCFNKPFLTGGECKCQQKIKIALD